MYSVDVYLRVRRAVMAEGMSIREAARTFGLHRDTVRKMLAYSVPPGYRRQSPPKRSDPSTSSGGILHRRHRPHPGRRPQGPQEAASHGPTHLRAAQGRVRVRRRIHHGQGLRERTPPPDPGDVRAPVASAGARPVRLRRGPGGYRRSGAEGPLLRPGPAPQRRLLCEGLSRREHRGLPGRPRVGLRLPGRSAPKHSLRQHQAGRGQDTGGRPAPAHPRLHRASVPLPLRGPVRASRQG